LFERIITHPYYKQFQPQVLSMPHNSTIHLDKSKVVDGPWIIVLDNFTTPEECDRIIELGTERGYEPSTSLRHGSEYQKRTSTLRTSFNTWCDTPKCNGDEATRRIHVKIENLTGIPERNSENLQLLRYELGQKCFVHNDYMEQHKDRRQGVRVLTVFLYLSDVPEGGETFFPDVGGIGVPPKKGRAVIWPSVRDDDPHAEDPRTGHGSSAVVSGIKYGANAFIHQRDAKSAYKWACF
jgi:prolyl 4-hydroxylase